MEAGIVASLLYRLNVCCEARQAHPEVRVHLKDLLRPITSLSMIITIVMSSSPLGSLLQWFGVPDHSEGLSRLQHTHPLSSPPVLGVVFSTHFWPFSMYLFTNKSPFPMHLSFTMYRSFPVHSVIFFNWPSPISVPKRKLPISQSQPFLSTRFTRAEATLFPDKLFFTFNHKI